MMEAVIDLAAAVRTAALAGAVADKDVKAAKAAIADGAVHHFDFWAHVKGSITKGYATVSPARESTSPADVNLFSAAVLGELLRKLGATSADLRKHLRAIVRKAKEAGGGERLAFPDVDAELLAPFEEVAAAAAKDLPPVKTTVPGKTVAGAVKVTAAAVEFSDYGPGGA